MAGPRAVEGSGRFQLPQSKMFADSALLPMLIEGTRLNFAFVIALGLLAAGYVFMQRSFLGLPDAGRRAG